MKNIVIWMGKVLTILTTWVSLISLRGFVIILGLMLALSAPKNHLLLSIDHLMLTASSVLFESPRGASGIAIVSVPREEMNTWQSDIHSSGKLAALLSNILNSSNASVGLLMQEPIDTGAGAADELIESMTSGTSNRASNQNAKALVDRKYMLMDLLANERVVVGVERFFFSGQKPILNNASFIEEFPPIVRHFLWPACNDCFSLEKGISVARPSIEQFTLIVPSNTETQALFHSEQGEYFNGFLIQLLRAIAGVARDKNLVWEKGGVLTLGAQDISISTTGRFIPLNSLTRRMTPIVNTIPLHEALARSAFPDIILVAADGNQAAEKIANAIYSVTHDTVLFSPWWYSLILISITLLVTLYLGFIATKMPAGVAIVVSIFFCVTLISSQLAMVLLQRSWLPLALPAVWLIVGHFLLAVWVIKKARLQSLVDRADDICLDNARQLLDRNELDEALVQVADCSLRESLLQTLYDISEAYTEQKDYGNAIRALKILKSKNKSFKDTEQKLQVLDTMLKADAIDMANDGLQKTTVISSSLGKSRMIGRYRLEKEIGRGAMGQVYLGFDTQISRRVAIKTLNYDQFRDRGHSEIKARFYREAEAAGRLNHPSIVSVFDIGEENDLAFIAMDFAEGKALNNFVSPDNLLPVFEVYRIVCDVAVALEYAHENNIVHRDIKPGNIIYNPSPYQIKVTDFGIARLVDNSKTSTGEILGSPLYMAPEQLKGKKVNRTADIFGLGVTFYQLLTGCLPYTGENLAALTYEIIHGRHRNARSVRKDLPASASRITNQALQKDPEDRYETAAEMALVLKKAIKRDFSIQAKRVGYV